MANSLLPLVADKDLIVESLARSETIPSSWYTDPGFHELDRQSIFNRSWQGAVHISRLKNIGDYIVAAGEMAFYYFVWPNFMLNILPDRLQTNLVLPHQPNFPARFHFLTRR